MATVSVLGPNEMIEQWQMALPNEVIEAFNEMLVRHFNGTTAKILEKDLLAEIKKKGIPQHQVREQQWLKQTQELYKEQGWKVAHKTPGWDDDFHSYFYFELK